jgi:CubicO group peptidase (beta-lactamase class C family)
LTTHPYGHIVPAPAPSLSRTGVRIKHIIGGISMTTKNEATSGARLCAVYEHRTTNSDPDRYFYSRERMIKDAEYQGTTRPAFFGATAETGDAVPVYLKSRKADGKAYYKLSLNTEKEGGYEPVGMEPWFWGFNAGASPGCPVVPVYEHGVPANQPGYPRYYYDLAPKNYYGWTDGTVLFHAVAPRVYVQTFFDSLTKKFFEEHHCPELALEATGVPGMAIAVVCDGHTTILRGYGVRDVVSKAGVDANTVFQLASVSKPITSTVVAALVGDGVLHWDDLVSKHFPDFKLRTSEPSQPQTVRVADMLAHCGGLPDHAGDLLEDIGNDRSAVLHQLRYLPVSPPRTVNRYTNFGFTAAAVAAAMAYSKHSGKETSWEDLASERLYQRLGMTRTSSSYEHFKDDPNCTVGYQRFSRYPGQREWPAPTTPRNPDAQSPAGGVRSCVADLAKWMQLQLNGGTFEGRQVVNAEALARTHSRYRSIDSKFGLGWNVSLNGDLGHSGAFLKGAATCVQLWPALGVGIIVLTNGEPIGVPEAVCWAFGDYLLGGGLPNGQTLESWLVRTAQMMNSALPVPKEMGYGTWVSDPTRELKEYCGKFTHEYYGPIEIKLDEGHGPGNSRRLNLFIGPDRREVNLNMWDGDTFVYQTFGENAVGLSAVEFDMTTPGKARVGVKNLSFSDTNPDYSETDTDPKEFARFTPEAGA